MACRRPNNLLTVVKLPKSDQRLTAAPLAADQAFCIDRQFFSAEELTILWKYLGFNHYWTQVSPGQLQGRFRVERLGSISLISIRANQALFVYGQRNPDWLPFAIELTDNIAEHRHFGEEVMPQTLGGFNTRLDESLLRTSPGGSHLGIALIERRRIEVLDALDPSSRLLEQMDRSNSMQLSEDCHLQLRQLMVPPAWQCDDADIPFAPHLLEAHLMECLAPRSEPSLRPVMATHHSDLVKELVQFSFSRSTAPVNLEEVCKALFTTKTTLTVSCREMFGFGPMALMKRIRLQQVHHVLSSPDLQRKLSCSTVKDVAEHFGFHSRNHFAQDYRRLFDATPRDTFKSAAV